MLKKNTFMIVLLLTSFLAFGSTSYAAISAGYANGRLLQTQVTGDAVWLNMTADNGAFTATWIKLGDSLRTYGLALALTAISLEKTVNVQIDLNSDDVYEIYSIGMVE